MPRSSRHRSHKQSKYSSKDYPDSEEDVRTKDKGSRDDNLAKASRDSATGEKRKISSQAREGEDGKDPNGCGNGEASQEYFSSKRRKEKTDIGDAGDRWNGRGEERGNSDRIVEKEKIKGDNSKSESKLKEVGNKGESSKMEWKNKDKKYESGSAGEMESSAVVVEKEDGRSKGESKRKYERDYSGQKEGKEYKGKDRRADKEKEKNLGQVRKRGDAKTNLLDMEVGRKQELRSGDLGVERKVKRGQENSDFPVKMELQNPDLEKEVDKRTRRRRESSSDRGKHHTDFKEGDERGLSSRIDRAKDLKYKDDKLNDRIYVNKYHEDDHKNDGQRDEKYHEEMKNDNEHRDGKHKEDVGKDARCREDRHRGDDDRDNRHKDEKHREDGEKDTKRKDDKHRDGADRRRDYRHREDSERESRRVDNRYRDGEKNGRHGDVRHYENRDRNDGHPENDYREDSHKDNITKEEKHREDFERESRFKDSKQADDFDREKRPREANYGEELATRDCSGDKSDPRHLNDGVHATDHHSKHSSKHDDSPMHDDRTVRCRDDQGRRRTTEKHDNRDVRSQRTNDQGFDSENRSGSEARMDSVPDRGRPTPRNADIELNLSHSRQCRSHSSNSLAPRDNHRLTKQDEYKHRDYSEEERLRHNMTSGRDYAMGGSEKTSSWSLEKLGQKDGYLRESSAERRLKSDIRSSTLKRLDKSPSSNTDRRQFNRSDVRRNIDIEELTQRSSGSRDMKDHTGKEGRERRELAMDVLPRDEHSQADVDTLSASSSFTQNNHLSGSSKSFPPFPPLKTGVDSPLMSGSIEDDSRFKSNSRHRRSGGDPNRGRIQGNPWRGVPSWPSTVPNGFMSFPHRPPPVSFHSVMQPFPAPAMFGIRPPVDSNHPAPYHITDNDRFSVSVRPMGWHNPVDDSCNPLHSWDASHAVFRDDAHSYGRPGNHSRSMPGGRGWDTNGDLWKGPSNTACLEMQSYGKENDFSLNIDEALAGQSIQLTQNEQFFPDEQAAINDVNQSTYESKINSVDAPINNLEDASNLAKISEKDDVPFCLVYLSKLDISADLTEPELFNQCRGFIDMDQGIISEIDDLKILFIEEAIEAKASPHQILRSPLSETVDDSVFQKAISLYESQKGSFDEVINGEKFLSANLPFTKSDHENLNIEDSKTEKPSGTSDNMQDGKDALSHMNVESTPPNTSSDAEGCTESAHQNLDLPPANIMVKSEEPISTKEHDNLMVNLASKLLLQDQIIEEGPLSVESSEGFCAPLPAEVNNDGNIEDVKSGVTSYGTLLTDVCSEAMTPELVVSESIILSRIHHSPESTH